MTAAITTLRASLAAALAYPALYNVYAYPPSTITANSVMIVPNDPYITPTNNTNIGISPMANFKIIFNVPMLDNAGNLQGIETLAVAVFAKLAASTIVMNIAAMSAPTVLEAQSGTLLTASFDVQILTSWS
jgi:hypothetical protein